MKVLVISTSQDTGVLNLLSAASKFTDTCDILFVGHNLESLIKTTHLAKIIQNIFLLDSIEIAELLPENLSKQLASIASNYTHVLINANSFGKSILPRIAAILNIGQISDVINILSSNIYQKYIYTGNVLIEIESLDQIKLLTVRASSFKEYDDFDVNKITPISNIIYDNQKNLKIKHIVDNINTNNLNIAQAKIVVSGGRALNSKENFDKYIGGLANTLGAAIGASRVAVEAGYASNDLQIGQTGKVVAPNIYFAIGISGAMQHIAGMKDSKIVIAINNDENAAIFEYADYGLIADLFTIIPQLVMKIQEKQHDIT